MAFHIHSIFSLNGTKKSVSEREQGEGGWNRIICVTVGRDGWGRVGRANQNHPVIFFNYNHSSTFKLQYCHDSLDVPPLQLHCPAEDQSCWECVISQIYWGEKRFRTASFKLHYNIKMASRREHMNWKYPQISSLQILSIAGAAQSHPVPSASTLPMPHCPFPSRASGTLSCFPYSLAQEAVEKDAEPSISWVLLLMVTQGPHCKLELSHKHLRGRMASVVCEIPL